MQRKALTSAVKCSKMHVKYIRAVKKSFFLPEHRIHNRTAVPAKVYYTIFNAHQLKSISINCNH